MDNKLKNRNARVAFYIYFLSMTAIKALGLSSTYKSYKIVFLIAVLFLAIKIFYTEYRPGELAIIVVVGALSLIGFFRAKEQTYLLAIMTIAGMKDIDFKDLCRPTLVVHSIGTFLCIINSMFFGGYDKVEIINQATGKGYHSYGYVDFNVLFVNVFIIAILLIYIRYEKLGIKEFVITNAIMFWAFKATHSRTGLILFFGTWVLIIIDKAIKNENKKRKLYYLYTLLPYLIVFLSFYLPYLYEIFQKQKWMYYVNRYLSGRLFIMNYYLKLYPFTFFGNSYEFWAKNAGEILEIVDNLYVTIFLYSGLVMLIIYLVALVVLMKKLYKNRLDIELIFTAVLVVYAFMEEYPLNPSVNPFALLIAWVIFGVNTSRGVINEEKSSDNNQRSVTLQS